MRFRHSGNLSTVSLTCVSSQARNLLIELLGLHPQMRLDDLGVGFDSAKECIMSSSVWYPHFSLM